MPTTALKIAAIYAVIGAAWIIISDRLAANIASNVDEFVFLSTAKGWLYVLVTTCLLYVLIKKNLYQLQIANMELVGSNEELGASEEELQRQVEELHAAGKLHDALYRISEKTNLLHTLAELYSFVHEVVGEFVLADDFNIALYGEKEGQIYFVYRSSGYEEMPLGRPFKNGLTEYVIRTEKPLLADPQVLAELAQSGEAVMQGRQATDWLGVPLKAITSQVMGVMAIKNNQGVRYTEKHRDFLVFVSSQIASAIERKRDDAAIRASREQYRFLTETMKDVVWTVDVETLRFTYVSPSVERIRGYTAEEVMAETVDHVMSAQDGEKFIGLLHEHAKAFLSGAEPDQYYTYEIEQTCKDGSPIWTEITTRFFIKQETGRLELHGVARDITERKQTEETLRYFSVHDSLTQLYNRAYFAAEMSRLDKRREGSVGLIMCDLDGLKLINDTFGHEHGDCMLRQIADILRGCFRDSDIIARIGGDEFVVLLDGENAAHMEESCLRIQSEIDKNNSRRQDIPIGLSTGYAVGNDPSISMEELYKESDHAMYRNKLHKRRGARNAVVQPAMRLLEARGLINEEHVDRLQDLISMLGKAMNVPNEKNAELCLLAQFHDIGKAGIPDQLLKKPTALTPEERKEIQRHCEIGHRIALSSSDLACVAEWILKHHEWWNGKGYPLELSGKDIPIECRMLSIVDAYDAMTSDRPYRKALAHEAAVAELNGCAGTQFDPKIVKTFVALFDTIALFENN